MLYTWQLIPLVKDWWVILLGAVTELGKCHYGWGSEWKVYVTENEGVKGVDAISGIFSSFSIFLWYSSGIVFCWFLSWTNRLFPFYYTDNNRRLLLFVELYHIPLYSFWLCRGNHNILLYTKHSLSEFKQL